MCTRTRTASRSSPPAVAIRTISTRCWRRSRRSWWAACLRPIRAPPAAARLGVELGIVAEDPFAVEGDAPPRGKILFQPRPRRHPAVQLDEQRITALEPAHRAREGIAQAGDHL